MRQYTPPPQLARTGSPVYFVLPENFISSNPARTDPLAPRTTPLDHFSFIINHLTPPLAMGKKFD
jgi:hypothetical protein